MAKILVVDDDFGIMRSTQLVLEAKGYEVLTADSEDTGREMAEKGKPDLMIVDVMMPDGMEGFRLVEFVRKSKEEALKNIPIIMLTGVHDATSFRFVPEGGDISDAGEDFANVQAWFDKPVEIEKLLAKIEELLPKSE